MTKRIVADYAQQADAGMTLMVAFDHEFLADTTANSYPKWMPPVNEDNSSAPSADKRTGTTTMIAKWDKGISFATPFPVNTTISNLREDTSTANPALPVGYIREDSKFTIGTVAGMSLTTEDQKTTKVNLLNTAGAADNGLQVVKKASGAEGAAAKKSSFSCTCTPSDNTEKNGQIADVLSDETPVASPEKFPTGTTCEVTEDTAGVDIGGYTLGPADHDAQSVIIGMGSEPTVTAIFTSTHTHDMGRFLVAKTVAGDAGGRAPDTYTFDYTCEAGGRGPITGTIIVGKGESGRSDEILVGYSCMVKERVDQGQNGTACLEDYTLDIVASPDVTIAEGAVPNIDVTNTYILNRGTFSVKKVVQGVTFIGVDSTFTVRYACTYSSVTLTDEQKAGSPILTGNGTAIMSPSLPFGTSCTTKEADGNVQRTGYVMVTAYTAGQVTVGTAAPSPEVTATNAYTLLEGRFDIFKTAGDDGAALAKNKGFIFDYTCTPLTGTAQMKGTVIIKGGEIGAVTDVPVGLCLISERDATIDRASLSTVLTIDDSTNDVNNGTVVFDMWDGTTVKVAATDTYILGRGSFSVVKTVVSGTDSSTRDTSVFDYVCMDGTEGCLGVLDDRTAVEGPRVPTGMEYTLTEHVQMTNRERCMVVSEPSGGGKVTITDRDMVAVVTAANIYTPVPTSTPPGKTLIKMGASGMLVLGVIGSVPVLVSGVLVVVGR